MKKIIFTMVAMMTFTLGYAKTENHSAVQNVEKYDMSFDVRRLAAKLELTSDQMEAFQIIQDSFNNEMLSVATAKGHMRRFLVHQAVRKDVNQMKLILNDNQFNTYVQLLGVTLRNKGL